MRRRRRAPTPPTSCGLRPRTADDLTSRPTPPHPPASPTTALGGDDVRRTRLTLTGALVVLSGCGLTSGSPMADDVKPRPGHPPIPPTRPPHTPRLLEAAR